MVEGTRSIHFASVAAAAALLALTGCANEPAEPEATTPPGASTRSETPADGRAEPTPPAETTAPTDEEEGSSPQDLGPLELTTSSGTTTLALTDVYCSGQPGRLHHLIGKTNHQPPLVEITPGEFAMVKVGQGRPYKTSNPSGVTVNDDGVTFTDTTLGDATLSGTVTCTTWEN